MQKNDNINKFFMWCVSVLFIVFFVECLRENNNTRVYILAFGVFAALIFLKSLFSITMSIPNSYFLFCVIFYLYTYVHTQLVSWKPGVSLEMVDRILVQYTSIYFVYVFFRSFKNNERVAEVFTLSGIFMACIAVISSISTLGKGRLGGMFNSNTIAVFSGYMSMFLYAKYLKDKSKKSLFLILFLIAVILLTGSRKGLLTVVLGLLSMNILMTKNYKLLKIIAIIPVAYIGYLLIMSWEPLYNLVGNRVEQLLIQLQGGNVQEASMISRTSLIEAAMKLIEKNPIEGYGLNCFRYMDSREMYSHNNYVELMFSGGIPMMAVYYIPHLIMLINSIKLMRLKEKRPMDVAIVCILIMMIINDFGMVSYYSKYVLILIMFMYTYLVDRVKEEKKNKLALEEGEECVEKENMLLHT